VPLPEAKGDAKAGNVIDHTISVIKTLRAARDQKTDLANEIKRATENWTDLKNMIAEIPADDAKKIAFFATDPVSWWLMTKEDGEKYDKFREILKSPGK